MKLRDLIALCLVASIVVAVIFTVIVKIRKEAALLQCQSNLRQIGAAINNYDGFNNFFPLGTVSNLELPPAKRLSWLTNIFPAYMVGGHKSLLDSTKSWDDIVNNPPRELVRTDMMMAAMREQAMGLLGTFCCPANPIQFDPSLPSMTHYIGVSGVGERAAEFPLIDPKAGFFGYDRKITRDDIKDGLSTTMMVAKAMNGGSWTAGGYSTVRGIVPGRPYLGKNAPFSSLHGNSILSNSPSINVLFVDGSVRRFTSSMSPKVFEAFATINGKEQVSELPE